MKVLVIYGSPRKNGNTDTILNELVKGVESAGCSSEKLIIRDLKIRPCDEGRACERTGYCLPADDMKDIYQKLETYERIVVGAPIFYYGVPSQLKALIDRSQCYWARKYLLKQPAPAEINGVERKGAFISVAGSGSKKVFDGADLTIRYFFDSYNIEYSEKFFINKIDKMGDVSQQPTALVEAFNLGKKICRK